MTQPVRTNEPEPLTCAYLWQNESSSQALIEQTNEQRQKTTTYAAWLAAAISLAYALLDISMEVYVGAAVNLAAGCLYLFGGSCIRRQSLRYANHLLIWTGICQIMVMSGWVIGTEPGAQVFLLGAAVIAIPLFHDSHRFWPWFYFVLPIGCLAGLELGALPPPLSPPRVGFEAQVIRSSCFVFTGILIFMVFRHYLGLLAEARAALDAEHHRSEELLRNILPNSIATRLKRGESVTDAFDEVTVLFADIVAFTPMAASMPASRLVGILNEIFSGFDAIAARHHLEKIKTIGDAYMVAGGLPQPRADHTQAVAHMALEMMDWMDEFRERHSLQVGLRIGVHTGPVVAGVIGSRKFIYDLWGDTVNLASRMESHGDRDRIQVSQEVFEKLGESFSLESRGPIELKGRGQLNTYWLNRQSAQH